MHIHKSLKTTFRMLLSIVPLMVSIQHVQAHTVLEVPQIPEQKRSSNNIVIGHGCGESPVIGTSVVIPDGVDSTITTSTTQAGGTDPYSGAVSDFLNWGNIIQLLQNRSVFSEQNEKIDSLGNVVGFWSGGGKGVSANLNAYIPFTINALFINSSSCAKSVRFDIAIVDVCKITPLSGVTDETAVSLWTPAVGSKYDGVEGGHSFNNPAFLTINRDLTTNPLPDTCGEGLFVYVSPSAAQIDRDMPIIFDGTQVWPQP